MDSNHRALPAHAGTLNLGLFETRFFAERLCRHAESLDAFAHLFDVRAPSTKRREFARIRDRVFTDLLDQYGSVCHLRCSPACTSTAEVVDHLIPLSSNRLNKLRGVVAARGKKVPTQSFGSNDPRNLLLSCRVCNAWKLQRFLERDELLRILAFRQS